MLNYHQDRVNRTFKVFFPHHDPLSLKGLIKNIPPSGKLKCRIVYGEDNHLIEFQQYSNRKISSLKLIEADQLDYSFKFLNRSALDDLYAQRESAEDIIIVKNGVVTDSYFANLAFFDGSEWWTPLSPLLKGVKRQYLLDKGELKEKGILKSDLSKYQKVSLVNAMMDLREVEVEIPNIGV